MFWLRKSLGSKCDEVERQSCRWTLGFVQSWPDNSFYFPNSRTVNQSMQSGYPKAMKVGVGFPYVSSFQEQNGGIHWGICGLGSARCLVRWQESKETP